MTPSNSPQALATKALVDALDRLTMFQSYPADAEELKRIEEMGAQLRSQIAACVDLIRPPLGRGDGLLIAQTVMGRGSS